MSVERLTNGNKAATHVGMPAERSLAPTSQLPPLTPRSTRPFDPRTRPARGSPLPLARISMECQFEVPLSPRGCSAKTQLVRNGHIPPGTLRHVQEENARLREEVAQMQALVTATPAGGGGPEAGGEYCPRICLEAQTIATAKAESAMMAMVDCVAAVHSSLDPASKAVQACTRFE